MKSKSVFLLLLMFNLNVYSQNLSDTIIDKIHYSWVKYDLNKNPYEIGQDFSNGIKNGKWIYRDQQGRITQIVHFKNDTLIGLAKYYEYLNDPIATKYAGLLLNGSKVGEWSYETKKNRNRKWSPWKKYGLILYDQTGRMISRSQLNKNGTKLFEAFYDLKGEECYWKFYDKKGNFIRETSEYPYITVAI